VQFTGDRVEFGMGREAMAQCAAEIGARDAVEFLGQLYRETSGFDDGVSAPAQVDDIRVGIVVPRAVARAGQGRTAERGGNRVGDDEAVTVPFRPAAAKPQAMHHPRAEEPMIGPGVYRSERIGPDAQQAAFEHLRNTADNRQVEGRRLDLDRCEIAFEVGVAEVGHGEGLSNVIPNHITWSRPSSSRKL
jgi:hypothetical protein